MWETATRQDAELLVHAFRAICKDYLPGGSTGLCELVSLPLPTIVRIMELIICKAAASKRILLAQVKPRELLSNAVHLVGVSPSSSQSSTSDSDARPLRAHLHYNDYGGSRCSSSPSVFLILWFLSTFYFSVLSPQRDNYRLLVLWEELGDCLRLDKGDIVRDFESWSAFNDEAKAAARDAAESLADREAKAAIEAKDASRAQHKADTEATAEQLQHRFLSMHDELEKTHNSLQSLRARATQLAKDIEPSIGHCATARSNLDTADEKDSALSLARMTSTVAGTVGFVGADLTSNNTSPRAASLPANDGEQQGSGSVTMFSNSASVIDAYAVAAAYSGRRQHHAFLSKTSEYAVASQHHR